MSEKEAGIEVQGSVEEALAGGMYRVKLELSPYDLTRGRITYRDK